MPAANSMINQTRVASYWQHDLTVVRPYASASGAQPAHADIVVVGGGFAGLATACRIAERAPAARVIVLEAETVGYGASGRCGGLVSPLAAPVWIAGSLRDKRQADALGLLCKKTYAASEWVKHVAPHAEVSQTTLHIEPQGRLTRVGLNVVTEILQRSGIHHQDGDAQRQQALRLKCYAMQPYKMAIGLATYAHALGVSICERAPVEAIEHLPRPKDGALVRLTNGHSIEARKVVLSTNAYSQSIALAGRAPGKIVRNFMMATSPLSEDQIVSIRNANDFVVELNAKYIFYRLHNDRLIFGGIDKVGQSSSPDDFEIPPRIFSVLRKELSARVPRGAAVEIDYAWGGRFNMTGTDLPVIGVSPETPSLIYNVGYGGTGIALTLALAPVAAAAALELPVEDAETAFIADVMRETRIPFGGGLQFVGRVARRLVCAARPPN